MSKTLRFLTIFAIAGLCSARSWADNVDPSNLHFGTGFNTLCYAGCAGDPNKVLGTGFDIYNVSDSNATNLALTTANPLLLIISVPNTTSATIASNAISSVTFYPIATSSSGKTTGTGSAAASGSTTYEVSPNTYKFSNPGFNSGSIYNFLNLDPQTDSSNSFANYTLAKNDPTATAFTVYVFDISGGTLDANGLVQINFTTPLPLGSITAAYTQGTHNGNLTNYDNAFTEAGIVSTSAQTPEPASMALFGTGLFGLAGLVRRRRSALKN